jgi:acetoin:2,6-dichlorophenolindophenol oxidoreductase subunit beta
MTRQLSMSDAIAEATVLAMRRDPNVFVMGVGVDDPAGIFGTTRAAHDEFGDARVFDVPISENCLTGMGVGAAISGMRPILVHARDDFLLLTMDQLANHAAKWSYMSGGALTVPLLVRAVIGRGWGQAAQHSQSLQAVVAHFPGLEVVMPASPGDAKGLILSALTGSSPVVCLEHRWCHGVRGDVPEGFYTTPIGRAHVEKSGEDVTIVALSQMVLEARKAAALLESEGVRCEVVDLRTVRPWDSETVSASVRKTRRLVVADTGWSHFGVGAEIAASVSARLFGHLAAPVECVGLPDVPTPCAPNLEVAYYPSAATIVEAVKRTMGQTRAGAPQDVRVPNAKPFTGPF